MEGGVATQEGRERMEGRREKGGDGAKRGGGDGGKGVRQVFQHSKWQEADIWEMEKLKPGNEIDGLAIIEASNTTLFVPPEWHVRIDEHDIYWLERKTGQ